MATSAPDYCVVIPCYNEAGRLDVESLRQLPRTGRYIFVDDGSTDATSDVVRSIGCEHVQLLRLDRNQGKAEAVRLGILHAKNIGLLADVRWVGFWDADMATPMSEAALMLAYAAGFEYEVDGILGSRIYKLGSRIKRSYLRHLAGRVFSSIAYTALALDCYDSQCGAKLFRVELVQQAFGEPFSSRWIFDLEILLRLKDRRLVEYPVRVWTDVPGGKLRVIPLIVPTLVDIARLWNRYR
jgi:glycosyltransferase involved in cell wall biosynthesis